MLTYLYSVSLLNVEPQYTGARIEDTVVTLDFVKKMMDNFKNQKCLHKRYQLKLSNDLDAREVNSATNSGNEVAVDVEAASKVVLPLYSHLDSGTEATTSNFLRNNLL
ncbi:unnamed protein product [Fraxinus pennsylvanica]|uniref:PPP domain-containing protein n=1 Tax=Fraxinus pennsylvanica TaxID=56036 RepID=A0AAD2AC22_9LAMI|nr:unnamed protein product [Fraxinus pennsylvanica]